MNGYPKRARANIASQNTDGCQLGAGYMQDFTILPEIEIMHLHQIEMKFLKRYFP